MIKYLVPLLLLAGCKSYMEYAAEHCDAYGFKQGTVEYSQCLQMEVGNMNAANQQAMQNLSNSLAQQQAAQQQQQLLRQQQQMRSMQTTRCNPNYAGGFNCSTW